MEAIPNVANYIDRPSYIEMCKSMPLFHICSSLFYGTWDGYPWAYHLWFMRDLITIIALCPLIYYIRKCMGLWTMAITLLLHTLWPNIMFLCAMFWFISGSFILNKLNSISNMVICSLVCVFFIMAVYRHTIGYGNWIILKTIEVSSGLCAFWCMYDKLVSIRFHLINHRYLNIACQYTFFLYLYHEPVYHIIVKMIIMVLGVNPVGAIMSIILPPILFTPVGLVAGIYLKKSHHLLYDVISGGR